MAPVRRFADNGRFLCECKPPRIAEDPRRRDRNTCARCLGFIDPSWVGTEETFRAFFGRLRDAIPKVGPPDKRDWLDAFITHCQQREAMGKEEFGMGYLARDNPVEAMEEAADFGIYMLLYEMRLAREGEDIPWDLVLEGAHHAALAWRCAQNLRNHRTEYLGRIDTTPGA